jgi:TPR repeat protein
MLSFAKLRERIGNYTWLVYQKACSYYWPLSDVEPIESLEIPEYQKLEPSHLRAMKDSPEAMVQLAYRHSCRIAGEYDNCMASVLYLQAAKLGHPVALGVCLFQGIGSLFYQERGLTLISESANRGHPIALELFARHCKYTDPENHETLIQTMFFQSAKLGNAVAGFELVLYAYQRNQKMDASEVHSCVKLVRAAALKDHVPSQLLLSGIYGNPDNKELLLYNPEMSECFFLTALRSGLCNRDERSTPRIELTKEMREVVDFLTGLNQDQDIKPRALDFLGKQIIEEADFLHARCPSFFVRR